MDLHREVFAAAEGSADTAQMDPHLLGLQAETGCNLVTVDVQPLRCDVDVDAALAVGDCETGLGPEERLVLDADLVDARHRHVGRRIGVTVPDDHVPDDVRSRIVPVAVLHRRTVGMERLLLGRPLWIGDEFERLVLDQDLLRSAASVLRMLRGDESTGSPK